MPDGFDVFLSHDSRDKPIVEEIAARLRARGVTAWLDKNELRPGMPWQEGLEAGVQASRAVAVFLGANGLGAWQEPEMRAFLDRSRKEKLPVIPVLLPGSHQESDLPLFLRAHTWVDLSHGLTDEDIERLIWGIIGVKDEKAGSGSTASRNRLVELNRPRRPWILSAGLLFLGLLLALGLWLRLRSTPSPPPPRKPEIYSVRVQVLDPQGQPVAGAKVRASAGNEPQLVPDGWWEVEIPAAKVPADGRITLWAQHEDWRVGRADLVLDRDPNPRAEIRLREPLSWLRGRVEAAHHRALAGIRITPQDGTPGNAVTQTDGRFEIQLPVPSGRRVGLRVERPDGRPENYFCLAGSDSCSITLEER
jgi:hypothetical protein